MKKLLVALALLPLLAPPTADAARREDRAAASQSAKAAKPAVRPASRAVATPTRRAAPSRQVQAAPTLRRVGGAARNLGPAPALRETVCTRQRGRTVCRPNNSIAGWYRDLSPPDHSQRDCPTGTFAIHARGHEDVVRCMPI
jgi:hypothetical protein